MSDFHDPYEPDEEPEGAVCKFCGTECLTWIHTGVRWRLIDDHGFHVCPNVATPDDFDVVKP